MHKNKNLIIIMKAQLLNLKTQLMLFLTAIVFLTPTNSYAIDLEGIVSYTVTFIFGLMLTILNLILVVLGIITDYIFNEVILAGVLFKFPGIDSVLFLVRDFANLLVVVLFFWIAVALILNIQKFNDKKNFIYLIVVSILINFSSFFVKVIIDFTNIIHLFFLNKALFFNPTGEEPEVVGGVAHLLLNIFDIAELLKPIELSEYESILAIAVLAITVGLGIYLFISLLRIALTVVIKGLYASILAPLAVVMFVYDSKSSLFTTWLKYLKDYVFILSMLGFAIYISIVIAQGVTLGSGGEVGIDLGDTVNSAVNLMIKIILIIVILRTSITQFHSAAGSAFAKGVSRAALVPQLKAASIISGGASKFVNIGTEHLSRDVNQRLGGGTKGKIGSGAVKIVGGAIGAVPFATKKLADFGRRGYTSQNIKDRARKKAKSAKDAGGRIYNDL